MAGSAVVGILRVLLTADTATFDTAMKRGAESAKVFSRDMNKLGAQATQLGSALTKTLTVPLLGLGVFAAKSAIDFQSAFAGVRKTVDATEAEFAQMSQAFRDLAKTIPISVNELARLGEAAGALGIPKAEIVDFSRVMALLGVTTNVTSDQAAESIAQIQTIFQAAGKDTEKFASTLVDLGNKGASTEAAILELANRLASAGAAIGMSQAEVLGFSSAIANVGINAEAGGSAVSKVFSDISIAVSKGGKNLEAFARIAGQSSEQFASLFKKDAAAAVQAFIEGLGKAKVAGGDLNLILEELGFAEVRQARALRDLALSGDNLAKSLNTANTAWRAGSALSVEAGKRFETVQSKLTLLWNRVKDVGITFGNALLPMITATIGLFDRLIPLLERAAKAFADLPMPAQATAIGLAGIAAAAGPALFVFGQLAFAAGALAKVFTTGGLLNGLSKFFGVAGGGSSIMTGLGAALRVFMGPVGWIIGIGSALLTVTGTWDEFFRILRAGIQIVRNVASALLDEFLVPLGKGIFGIGKDVLNWLDRFLGGLMPISDRLKVLGATFTWLMGKAADFAENLAGIPRRITVFLDTEFAVPARQISPGGAERGERPSTSQLTQAAAGSASFAQQLAGARKEIAALSAAVRSDLVAAIQSGAFSMEDLKKKTTLSELALKLFEDQVKGTGTATKKTAEEGIKLLADSLADAWKQRAQTLDFMGLREIAELERIYNLEQQGLENNLQIQADLIQQSWNERARMLDFNGLRAMAEIEAQYKDELVRANHFTTTLGDAFAKIPSILVSAFTGGGGIKGAAKALGATFGADLMSGIFGSAGSKGADGIFKAGTGLLKNLSGMLGQFFGQALPVIGSLIGPAIDAIVKLFGDHAGKDMKKMGKQWGVDISDGLLEQLRQDAKKYGGEMQAMLMNLDKIIAEAGGVKVFGIDKAIAKTRDLFVLLENPPKASKGLLESVLNTGSLSAEEIGAQFNKLFSEILPEAIDKTTGFAKEEFLELIALAQRFGVESEAALKFLSEMASKAATGLGQIATGTLGRLNEAFSTVNSDDVDVATKKVRDLEKQIGSLKKHGIKTDKDRAELKALTREFGTAQQELEKVTQKQKDAQDLLFSAKGAGGQEEFDRFGRLAAATFATGIASGKPFLDVLAEMGPALDEAAKAQENFGVKASGAFAELINLRKFSKENKALVGTLDGVNNMMVGLKNSGMLTQTAFSDLNAIAVDTFDKMVKKGLPANQALVLMQPSLQKIWELQKDFGYEVDENTQKLIDQGLEAGIVGDQHRSASDRMVLALEHVATVIDLIAIAFGVTLPEAAEEGARKTQAALDGIEAPDLNVGVKWDGKIPSLPDIFRGPFRVPTLPDSARSGAASGALVKPWGLQHLAFGGVAGALARFQHGGFAGTDTVPAMLTPGELVLNAAQQRNLAAVLSGSGRAPVTINVYTTIDGVFSENDLDQTMTRFFVPKITRIIEDNVNGARTNLQDVLGVP